MSVLYKKYVRLSCRQASQLLVKQPDARLTLIERGQLWWHLRLCDPCARFARQARVLDHLLMRNVLTGRFKSTPTLRPERRTAMAEEIKNRLN